MRAASPPFPRSQPADPSAFTDIGNDRPLLRYYQRVFERYAYATNFGLALDDEDRGARHKGPIFLNSLFVPPRVSSDHLPPAQIIAAEQEQRDLGLDEVYSYMKERPWLFLQGMGRYPRSRFLITSRIVGFSQAELFGAAFPEGHLWGQRARLLGALVGTEMALVEEGKPEGFEALPVAYLAPFGIAQVERFARNWYGEYIPGPAEHRARIADLMDRLARNEGLGGLSRVPVLLNMILFIHARRGRLPDGRAELYERIAETYLVALDRARQLRFKGRELSIDYQDLARGLSRIALAMQRRRTAEGAAVLLGEAEVKRHLREVLIESGYTEEVADTEVGFVLAYIAERSGLLLPRGFEAGEERYAYAHLSFQEFFAARALHAEIARPAPDPEPWGDLASWSCSPQWHETLVLLFELFTDPGLSEYCADKLFGLAEGGVRVLEVLRQELTDRKGVVSSEPLALLAELAMDTAVRLRREPRERLIRAAWESVFALSENLNSKEQLAVLRGSVSHLWAPRFPSFDLLRQAGAGRRHLILPSRAVADLTPVAALTALA